MWFHRGVKRSGATQVALAFLRHPRLQMTRAGLAMFCMALGSQAKTLLGSLVGFLLRHLPVTPSIADNLDGNHAF